MTRWAAPAVAVLVAILVSGGVALALAARVPDVSDEPLAPDHLNFAGVPIELVFSPGPDGDRTVRVPLRTFGDPTRISGADEIQIEFATFVTSPALRAASLIDDTGRCRFAPPPGETLRNNATTRFVRQSDCGIMGQTLELMIRIGPEGRLALWAYDIALTDPVPGGLMPTITGNHERGHVLRGRIVTTRSGVPVRRSHLVAHVWTGTSDTGWLWTALVMIGVALATGLLLAIGALGRGSVPAAIGVAVVAGVTASLWAIVVPPLQGADEPDHLLSYAEIAGRPGFEEPLRALARRTHFERIRFHGSERFRPADRHTPAAVAWTGDVHSERMGQRSPLTVALWRVAGSTVARPRDLSPSSLLLRLRLFNAAVFALAAGAAAWLLGAGGTSRWTWLALAPVPSLAYFGMAVSDWAFVTSGAVVLGGALTAVAGERGSDATRGAALGLALAWLVSTSMSSLALGPLIVSVLGARILLGPSGGASAARATRFWGALSLGIVLCLWLTADLLRDGYARYDAGQGDALRLLDTVNRILRLIADDPWLLLILPALAGVLEVALTRVRQAPRLARAGGMVMRIGVAAAGLAVLVVLIVSAWVSLPTLRPNEILPYPSARSYIEAVVTAFASSFRLTNIDHLMFASFWSGFGWIDAILPAPWLAALAAATAVALAIHAARAARAPSGRAATWTAALGMGVLCSAATLAVAGFFLRRNVHGRYLIGLYTPLIILAWQSWAHICARPRAVGLIARMCLSAALVLVHICALTFVIHRYY